MSITKSIVAQLQYLLSIALCYTKNMFRLNRGFTVLELLVVLAIIGVLATVVIISSEDGREKGKIAAARSQLVNVRTGIYLLYSDTKKIPGGCPLGDRNNIETNLDDPRAGLHTAPPLYAGGGDCRWLQADIDRWNGPYITTPIDPWGRPYQYDPDYVQYRNCPDIPEEPITQAILSLGRDGITYSCDDVIVPMSYESVCDGNSCS